MKERILVDKTAIIRAINLLKVLNDEINDKSRKKDIISAIEVLENEVSDEKLTIKQKIEQKIKETKHTNSELNADLYILYRRLSDGKITDDQAVILFENYLKMEPFEKRIY